MISTPTGVIAERRKRLRRAADRGPHFALENHSLDDAGTRAIQFETLLREKAENELIRTEALLDTTLAATTDAMVVVNSAGEVEIFNHAAERVFGYVAAEVVGRHCKLLFEENSRTSVDAQLSECHTLREDDVCHRIQLCGKRKCGRTFFMRLAAHPVRFGNRRLFLFQIRDLTSRRELKREILEISTRERQRIGQDLHDGLGQELTGIGFLAKSLHHKLVEKGDEALALTAAQLVNDIQGAFRHLRRTVKGLAPIQLRASMFVTALREFAANCQRRYGIRCTLTMTGEVTVRDDATADHLFRIVQEAVSNAARHGHADSIEIGLESLPQALRITIEDNGVGIDPHHLDSSGLGLRIMAYRAEVIGGILEIRRAGDSGTVVSCLLPQEDPVDCQAQKQARCDEVSHEDSHRG